MYEQLEDGACVHCGAPLSQYIDTETGDIEFENKLNEAYSSYVCKCIKDSNAPMSRETFIANFSHRIIRAINKRHSLTNGEADPQETDGLPRR